MFRSIILLLLLVAGNAQITSEETPIGLSKTVILTHLDSFHWVIELDDQSYWNVLPLKKNRKKTWGEWWNRIIPLEWSLDDDYFFDPNEWTNAEIQVYELEEAVFPGYFHLLVNLNTGQKAFAEFISLTHRPVPTLEFCSKFFNFPLGPEKKICNEHFMRNIIILEDNTIWRVIVAEKKPGWFSRWWYGKQIIPSEEPFVKSLSSWAKKDSVQIYSCPDEKLINSIYDSKNRRKVLCLIENRSKNELAYCYSMSLLDFEIACKLFAKEYYDEGYSDGQTAQDYPEELYYVEEDQNQW